MEVREPGFKCAKVLEVFALFVMIESTHEGLVSFFCSMCQEMFLDHGFIGVMVTNYWLFLFPNI